MMAGGCFRCLAGFAMVVAMAQSENQTAPAKSLAKANGTVLNEGLKVRSMSRPVTILHISDTHSLHRSTGNLPDAASWHAETH